MNTRMRVAKVLVVIGPIAMVIGAIDPLEGAFIAVPGSATVALGAYFAQSPKCKLVYSGFIVLAIYLATIMIATALGGWGANARVLRSDWYGLCLLLFPVGWLMCAAGNMFALTELFEGQAATAIWGLATVAVLVWQCFLAQLLLGH